MYKVLCSIMAVVIKILFRVEIKGLEEIPEGPLIVCSNHNSGWDPFFVATHFKRPIRFMGKRELFDHPLLRPLLNGAGVISVDRDATDIKSIKKSLGVLKNDEVLGIFPEGTRVKNVDLGNMKEGIGLLASRSKAPILVLYIESKYKLFSKVVIHGKGIVDPREYEGNKKEQYYKITKAVYDKIYQMEEK
ncbi:MAG: lysophospholipid acyltransferase family protein [Tissierellia bacterium]|nr:lysophospholipid acyltransferase family protein [Tissierellia bacterium]